ncbi:MAG: lysine exporter LysO family protein [Candidatus Methanomethylicia archaeon]
MKAIYTTTTLMMGIIIGITTPMTRSITWILDPIIFTLILLVGIDIGMQYEHLIKSVKNLKKHIHLPLITIVLSTIAGILATITLNINYRITLAISLGMGWYSFTGAYITTKINAYYGAIAFISNMFREAATITITPILPNRIKKAGIIIGGATTMDTTLPIMAEEFREEDMIAIIYHGLIITIIIPIILSTII